jgi:hypothetical protein
MGKTHPHLIKEWHSTKNGDLTPFDVQRGSDHRVWWICLKLGHEWKTKVCVRTSGSNCPICSAKRYPSHEQSLFVISPDLCRSWHPTKNGDLTPDQVFPYDSRKVWWRCELGHEWQTPVKQRTGGSGCHSCAHTRLKPGESLGDRNPSFLNQWHPTKNKTISPKMLMPNSHQKVWWRCENNHDWKMDPGHRCRGQGCPYCAKKKIANGDSLADRCPELAELWHPTKNGSLSTHNLLPGSGRSVWWQCKNGHEWKQQVKKVIHNKGCLYCMEKRVTKEYSFGSKFPVQAKEWHPDKNANITPYDVFPASNRRVWWRCSKGHEWQVAVYNRRIRNCPYCSGRRITKDKSLAHHHLDLSEQWHYEKNPGRTPQDTSAVSQKKHWWLCQNGHEWFANLRSRLRDDKCPSCGCRPKPKTAIQQVNTVILNPLKPPVFTSASGIESETNDETLTCLICGLKLPSLLWHIKVSHSMTADMYQKRFMDFG